MKNIMTNLRSRTRRILPLLISLTLLFNVAFGQAPVTEEEAKDFEQKFNYLMQLAGESEKLVNSQDPASREAGKAKLQEAIELSQGLFKKLSDHDGLGKKVGPTIENAKIELQLLLRHIEIGAYRDMGNYYYSLTDWRGFIEHNESALQLIRKTVSSSEFASSKNFPQTRDSLRISEMTTLSGISSALLYKLDKPGAALGIAEEAIQVARQIQREKKDGKTVAFAGYVEAQVWEQMAQIHSRLNDRLKSIECSKQALQIYRSLPGQKDDVIGTLRSIGLAYFYILDYENALKYLNEALKSSEEIGDKYHQSLTLSTIANLYFTLGNEQKEREMHKRRLEIVLSPDYAEFLKSRERAIPVPSEGFKDSGTSSGLADDSDFWRYSEIGVTYLGLKEYDKSIEYTNKALQLVGALNLPAMKRAILALIARAYRDKEDWQNALIYYRQASEISLPLSDKSDLGIDLANLGFVYLKLRKWQDALPNATQSLLIFQSLSASKDNVDTGYAYALDILSQIHNESGNRRLAIFYGKQAVNAIQRERLQLKNLDQESQLGYLKKNEKPYRRLADWLIAEGRIAEAEHVLALLKEDELFEYLRRDDKVAKELLDKIPLNDPEREAYERYEQIAGRITVIGKEHDALDKASKQYKVGKFPQQSRLDDLDNQLTDARKVFNRFLGDLSDQYFNKEHKVEDVRVAQISGTRALLSDLKQPRTVILSTIAGEDRLNIIVTTSKVNRAHTVDIKAEELNRLVAEFRAAAQNPNLDPRPAGKKLYDKLFPPDLQKDLEGVKADTIVWSLDGTLRYAPLAALWDGKRYLAEKYSNSVITLASRDKLKDRPGRRGGWTVLGVGVSKPFGGFSALPAVPHELCSVVNDPQKKAFCAKLVEGKKGLIRGVNLPDEEFTLPAFKLHLGRYNIVHIASHFSLNAGSEASSYLLLGGGRDEERKLSLAAVRDEIGYKLNEVELLTLSACNTAMSAGERSSGAEIESFGAIAQKQGTKSVLATLWSVADASTQALMSGFYGQLQAAPNIGKAEALRKAQLSLLNGGYKAGETPLWRGPAIAGSTRNSSPQFARDNNAPYAHPYFWSPFVLFGVWR